MESRATIMSLQYKIVSAEEYVSTESYVGYDIRYPSAPHNQDKTEFCICGEGLLNELQMRAYKTANWPQEEEVI